MSEEFVNGCIQHKDIRHIRIYYDYMDIYGDNEVKAKIVRILETWTNTKRAQWYKENLDRIEQGKPVQEPDFWVTMSYQQFREFMRNTANVDTIKKYLAELEKAKHIQRRINPENPYGAPQYLLNYKKIQAEINKLSTPSYVPALPPGETDTPPGNFTPPTNFTPTQGVSLPLPRGENYPVPGDENTPTQGGNFHTSNNKTKNYLDDTNDSDEERENASAIAPTRAPAVSLAEESENDVRPTPKFMSAPFWRPPSESRESEMTHDELARGDSALRGDRGSEPIGDRLPAHSHPATAAQAQVAPQQTAPTLSQDGAARTSPSGPRASGGKATPTKRAPKADELPLKCDTAEVRKRLASKRGYALEDKTEIIRENTAVKAWCAKHDLDVCDVVLAHLTMYDPYWSKPENKYRICGWHLLKETPRVLAELERRRKLAPPQPAREEALYTAPLPVLAPVREARRR